MTKLEGLSRLNGRGVVASFGSGRSSLKDEAVEYLSNFGGNLIGSVNDEVIMPDGERVYIDNCIIHVINNVLILRDGAFDQGYAFVDERFTGEDDYETIVGDLGDSMRDRGYGTQNVTCFVENGEYRVDMVKFTPLAGKGGRRII